MKFLFALLMLVSPPLSAGEWDDVQDGFDSPAEITVYRAPNCLCCHRWIQHLQQHHFTVIDKVAQSLAAVSARRAVPDVMRSCHTAVINGYLIEGHVPAGDIKRLLIEKPPVKGLSVPGMPVGTPGMEMGDRKDNFSVIAFDGQRQFRIFSHYEVGPDQQYHQVPIGE